MFAVLADARRYPDWVVGAAQIRDHDASFPAPGSRLHHEVGSWPLTLSDHTEVLDVDPPRRISLKAKARPLGTARIDIELSEAAGGTNVLMDERPGDRLTAMVAGNPIADAALRVRNATALGRLKNVVEGRDGSSPAAGRRPIAGQRILITGATSGIGLAAAEALARDGARIALLARGEAGLDLAKARLREVGAAEALTVAADVSDRESIEEAVEAVAAEMGGLDTVISGAAAIAFGPFAETDSEDFDATVATVFNGAVNTIRAALPHLERSQGAIVAVGSIAAKMPLPGFSAYTASKHALAGFLDTLRVELDDARSSVTVSLVNPGAVDTPLWDNLESSTGLLPPVPPASYSPETVAEAIVEIVEEPRDETIVGIGARAQVAFYSLFTGLGKRAMAGLSRLSQAGDERRAVRGALRKGRGTGRTRGAG